MIRDNEASKEGVYGVYLGDAGQTFYVLEGLSETDIPIDPRIQSFIRMHYDAFALFYSLLLVVIVLYLLGIHIVIPLLRRRGLY
jgi:hypothetical protein